MRHLGPVPAVGIALALLSLQAAACGPSAGDPPSGAYNWDVALEGTKDSCNKEMQSYSDAFTYSLLFEGTSASLYIGEAQFASGTIQGCGLQYEGPVIGEQRGADDAFWVQWQLAGDAVVRLGGSGCDLSLDEDWNGTEVFTLVSSDDPSIPAGCTYTVAVTGTYQGQ
jgi:hypothetical protein